MVGDNGAVVGYEEFLDESNKQQSETNVKVCRIPLSGIQKLGKKFGAAFNRASHQLGKKG
jgi:hypothetical protein